MIGILLIPILGYQIMGRSLGTRRLWGDMLRIDLVVVKGKSAKGGLLSAEVGDWIVIALIVFNSIGVRELSHMACRCRVLE